MMKKNVICLLAMAWAIAGCTSSESPGPAPQAMIYQPGRLKPLDSRLAVRVGMPAPGFRLQSLSGREVSLADFRGRQNVILSFVPAAFTPVCSAQWPGYALADEIFSKHDAVMLGITTDNIPSLHAWTGMMGKLPFDVLSDFWPHGEAAKAYGVLRSDGTTERALFLIDKQGVLRWLDVHDINVRPPLDELVAALDRLPK